MSTTPSTPSTPPSTPGAPVGAWRVADADRQAAVEALGEHYATGRLDQTEFDERSERAWRARYDGDLTSLFTDLPLPHGAVVAEPPRAARPRPSGFEGRRPGRPGRPGQRFPVGPLIFAAFVLAFVLKAFWLVFLVPAFLWLVVRPMRRHHGVHQWRHHGSHHWAHGRR